jgi:hypothetical protein
VPEFMLRAAMLDDASVHQGRPVAMQTPSRI